MAAFKILGLSWLSILMALRYGLLLVTASSGNYPSNMTPVSEGGYQGGSNPYFGRQQYPLQEPDSLYLEDLRIATSSYSPATSYSSYSGGSAGRSFYFGGNSHGQSSSPENFSPLPNGMQYPMSPLNQNAQVFMPEQVQAYAQNQSSNTPVYSEAVPCEHQVSTKDNRPFYPYSQIEEDLRNGTVIVTEELLRAEAQLILQLGSYSLNIKYSNSKNKTEDEFKQYRKMNPHLESAIKYMVDNRRFCYYWVAEEKNAPMSEATSLKAPHDYLWTLIMYYFDSLHYSWGYDNAIARLEGLLNESLFQDAMTYAACGVSSTNVPWASKGSLSDSYREWIRRYHPAAVVKFLAENVPGVIYGNIALFTSFRDFFFVEGYVFDPKGPFHNLLKSVSLAYLDQLMSTCPSRTLSSLIYWYPHLALRIPDDAISKIVNDFDPTTSTNLTAFVENYSWLVLDSRFKSRMPNFVNNAISFSNFEHFSSQLLSEGKFLCSLVAYIYFTEKTMATEAISLLKCWKKFCQLEEKQEGLGKYPVLSEFMDALDGDVYSALMSELLRANSSRCAEERKRKRQDELNSSVCLVSELKTEFKLIVDPIISRLRRLRIERFKLLRYLGRINAPLTKLLHELATNLFHPVLRETYAYRNYPAFFRPCVSGDALPLPRVDPSGDVMTDFGLWSALWKIILFDGPHDLDLTLQIQSGDERLWVMPYTEMPFTNELLKRWVRAMQLLESHATDSYFLLDLNIAAFNLIFGPAHPGMDEQTATARLCAVHYLKNFVRLQNSVNDERGTAERALYFAREEAKDLTVSLSDSGIERNLFDALERRGRNLSSRVFTLRGKEGTFEHLREVCLSFTKACNSRMWEIRHTREVRNAFVMMGTDINYEDWLKIADDWNIMRTLEIDPLLPSNDQVAGLLYLLIEDGEVPQLLRRKVLVSFVATRLAWPGDILESANALNTTEKSISREYVIDVLGKVLMQAPSCDTINSVERVCISKIRSMSPMGTNSTQMVRLLELNMIDSKTDVPPFKRLKFFSKAPISTPTSKAFASKKSSTAAAPTSEASSSGPAKAEYILFQSSRSSTIKNMVGLSHENCKFTSDGKHLYLTHANKDPRTGKITFSSQPVFPNRAKRFGTVEESLKEQKLIEEEENESMEMEDYWSHMANDDLSRENGNSAEFQKENAQECEVESSSSFASICEDDSFRFESPSDELSNSSSDLSSGLSPESSLKLISNTKDIGSATGSVQTKTSGSPFECNSSDGETTVDLCSLKKEGSQ